MKKKIWLLIAAILVLIGGILFAGVMTVLKWDFTKLQTTKYETNCYEITDAFQNISIITNTSDIRIVPSEDTDSQVTCYEQKNVEHSVAVKDGTLVITVTDNRKWYEHINIGFSSPKITVSIPKMEYGTLSIESTTGNVSIPKEFHFVSMDISETTGSVTSYASATDSVRIKTTTGNICVENIETKKLDLSVSTGRVTVSGVTCNGDVSVKVSTGKVNLTDIRCDNIRSEGNTGDITLKNVIAAEEISVERSTGSVTLTACDGAEIFIETDTGNIVGSLLTEKMFLAQTDTGSVSVPKSTTGGRCELTTDTGDIRMEIE